MGSRKLSSDLHMYTMSCTCINREVSKTKPFQTEVAHSRYWFRFFHVINLQYCFTADLEVASFFVVAHAITTAPQCIEHCLLMGRQDGSSLLPLLMRL